MPVLFRRLFPGDERLTHLLPLLHQAGLRLEKDVEVMVAAYQQGRVVACGGLAGRVLKCIAIDPARRGEGLSLTLMTELITLAFERGRPELFLFTKPENHTLFAAAGFFPLAEVPGYLVLMENSPDRLRRHCGQLRRQRQPGQRIGAIVMNANPFTLGHRWLVEQAAARCDWLHLLVVQEDASQFRYADRYPLIAQGTHGIRNLTLHPGSAYVISRATFPGYFLKDQGVVDICHSQIDLQLFRRYLAPALGITHRFVGTEPFCPLTAAYNRRMQTLLTAPDGLWPTVEVVELPRLEINGAPVSASRVRALLAAGDWNAVAALVPPATLAFLRHAHRRETTPA
ncbi:[citrate (pro-3S)-lyase] ligase [Chimaeribacter arupi]|uniref:[Citrate [pro-3S]-lyase] ligase n=1 Tax=Chimaeribacter arupi TaxID=2060066 RepID=A0A2N5ERS4_9GAMM|nr:[citrate (pro-3S)-lyase] ligase [Chimaeribacter arupi]PLR52540.1 [citrate (pro-3S)-lyase] ligase [Chimaeribacter arupi]